jgi:tetratricopeptide (TPR) repeat protein
MRAIKGVGDAMMALKQYADARVVYGNYITRVTEDDDPDAPEVHLSCAEAGRREGALRRDPLAYDQAVDVLHSMLEKFAERPSAAVEVHQARLALGELLVEAGRWREAETQLKLFTKGGAGSGPHADQLDAWLAECAFHLGRVDEARAIYERLCRVWRAARGEVLLPPAIYQTAALRVGQCYMREKEPRWVHALFAFMRARLDFAQSTVGPEIAIAIARCYAELNRDEDSVAVLWQLIKQDARDPRPGRMQLDQLLGELEGGLSAYPGPIRARVLFYIAQAEYRQALRDRKQRAAMAETAMAHFERVLAENPGPELSAATRLGLSRAALLAGQDQRAVVMLTSLLRDATLDGRDKAVAAQLLGGHYRDKGMLREAIKAFRGEVE